MNNTPYIDRGGEMVFAPPYLSEDIHHFSFACGADSAKLQAACDKYFNTPLGVKERFIPAGPFVLFVSANLPKLRATTPPYSEMGWFSESEMAIWMLVLDKEQTRFFWFVPYIWVDNPYAMVMGREVYGFPKAYGTIVMPTSFDAPDLFTLDTLAFRTYSPDQEIRSVRLLEIHRLPNVKMPHGVEGVWDDMKTFTAEIVRLMDDKLSLLGNLKVLFHGVEDLLELRIPTIFLKEIRDNTNPALAAFQSIVETRAAVTKFHVGQIYSEAFEVQIEDCISHPIREEFGLAPSGPIRPDLSFSLHFDFEIGVAQQTIITG